MAFHVYEAKSNTEVVDQIASINPSKKKGFFLFKVQFWIDALIVSSFTNPIISVILIKDVEGETLVKIAAVHFGNAITHWMNEIGILKAIFTIHYFCACFLTNALMNLFTGLSCYFFSIIFVKPYRDAQNLYVKVQNILKNLSDLYACFDVGRCGGKRIWTSFFLVTADGCLQAFTGISYFMGLETGWTTSPHSHVFLLLYSITYIFNWTFFIVIAGEVHEQDAVFKKSIALNVLKCPENLKNRQLNLLNSLKLKIAISAWGYFDFNRSLIMVAIGAVLTYSILVTQL
ncbi:hypothetical protein CEXT_330711 [Caerostris extrusa]|uniref:Gustatory receptor n=1 Tax=Caerostris extrusa TaxID=172846 RepID=A0AAV4SUN7_CAEEX|nr:hypothetical protein CEXT_330711 [Caerostris extrusa]